MANPANQRQAARIAHDLLVRRLPGSRRGSVRAHLQRAERIAESIWRRWQMGPFQWQTKHLRWYLAEQTRTFSRYSNCVTWWWRQSIARRNRNFWGRVYAPIYRVGIIATTIYP